MEINEATLHAVTGDILMLPDWHGYFYWNYSTNELNFRNGNYHLDFKQLKDKGIFERNDWYWII